MNVLDEIEFASSGRAELNVKGKSRYLPIPTPETNVGDIQNAYEASASGSSSNPSFFPYPM